MGIYSMCLTKEKKNVLTENCLRQSFRIYSIKFNVLFLAMERLEYILVQSREESSTTGDQVYILSDGRRIHHQSRMFIVPRDYYKNNRTIFDFFNLEYLEADGHFILRIIGTNAR